MATRNLIALLVVSVLSLPASAQTDFFWSTQDLNSGATNSDAVLNLSPGESGSLFLYYTTNGPADSDLSVGAFLDVATSEAGIIQFTDAETIDFAIAVGDIPIVNRWLDDEGGGGSAGHTGSVSDNLIDEWHAFTIIGGVGILEPTGTGGFIDTGFDQNADAFLFGRIDFIATMLGSVVLFTEAGDGQIVNGEQIVPATFGAGTIVVSVPEPDLTLVIALLIACSAGSRRHWY